MPCDPTQIACQVSRLVDATDGWDWNAFISTLAATLLGATISLLGVWLGYQWQRKQRYVEAVDDSIAKVLEQIAVHATALHQVQEQQQSVKYYERKNLDYFEKTGEKALSEPADFTMAMTLETALMRARGADQSIVTDALRVHKQVQRESDIGLRIQMLDLLGRALSQWRSKPLSIRVAREELMRVSALAEPIDVDVPMTKPSS
jgi:hypothetical protein